MKAFFASILTTKDWMAYVSVPATDAFDAKFKFAHPFSPAEGSRFKNIDRLVRSFELRLRKQLPCSRTSIARRMASMNKHLTIVGVLGTWFIEFAASLDEWEGWLTRVEQAYLTGEYERLQELEGESQTIQSRLADAREARRHIIQLATKQGFSGSSITSLVRWLGSSSPAEFETRLLRLEQQLRRAQQMSTALWVTGFQASSYTGALLEILATGNSDRATYGTCEREVLEGGHIVDAAA